MKSTIFFIPILIFSISSLSGMDALQEENPYKIVSCRFEVDDSAIEPLIYVKALVTTIKNPIEQMAARVEYDLTSQYYADLKILHVGSCFLRQGLGQKLFNYFIEHGREKGLNEMEWCAISLGQMKQSTLISIYQKYCQRLPYSHRLITTRVIGGHKMQLTLLDPITQVKTHE